MTPRPAVRPLTMRSRPEIVRHEITDPRWTLPDLTIAVLADFHVCRPWTPLAAVERIVARTNALAPDLILLAGDFIADRNLPAKSVPAAEIVAALAPLRAPLGVAAVLGNHDWWDCKLARSSDYRRNSVREALDGSGIRLLANEAERVGHGSGFWLVGFDSQRALRRQGHPGLHDPEAAFGRVPAGAPAILMAHEPDYFAQSDPRAFLQISGHTHGGQMNLRGWRPMTPSKYGSRYAWGHIREGGRHLIVSGGLGYSGFPLRIFQPPEITLVMLRCGG